MSVAPDRKIIDLLNEKKAEGVKTSISLEYFPPRTEDGVQVGYRHWLVIVVRRPIKTTLANLHCAFLFNVA